MAVDSPHPCGRLAKCLGERLKKRLKYSPGQFRADGRALHQAVPPKQDEVGREEEAVVLKWKSVSLLVMTIFVVLCHLPLPCLTNTK